MFDGSVPVSKPGGTGSGGGGGQDVQLHISMIVDISKGKGGKTLEIMCSIWPDQQAICPKTGERACSAVYGP